MDVRPQETCCRNFLPVVLAVFSPLASVVYIALPKKRPRGRPKLTGEDVSRPHNRLLSNSDSWGSRLNAKKNFKLNQNTSEEGLLALCTVDLTPRIYSNLEKVQEKAGVIRLVDLLLGREINGFACGLARSSHDWHLV